MKLSLNYSQIFINIIYLFIYLILFIVKNLELRDFLLPEDIPVPPSTSGSSSQTQPEPFNEELLNPDNVSSKFFSKSIFVINIIIN